MLPVSSTGQNRCSQVMIGFGFTSDWSVKWSNNFLANHKAIQNQSNHNISFDTLLKTALMLTILLRTKLKYCYLHFSKVLLKNTGDSSMNSIHLTLCTKQGDLSKSLNYCLSIAESVGKIHFTNEVLRQTPKCTLHGRQVSECAV